MTSAQVKAAVHAAAAAPSVHATSPWRFAVGQDAAGRDTVDLYADRSRQLAHVDPLGRLLMVSCGLALWFVRAGLDGHGHDVNVELLPDPADLDHLATVTVAEDRRRSTDGPGTAAFRSGGHTVITEPDRAQLRAQIADAVGHEGVWLRWLDSVHDRTTLSALTIRAARILSADCTFQSELREWLRDGPFASVTDLRPADDLVVVGTPFDGPTSWLDAGQAAGRLVLCASGAGMAVAPVGEALTVPWTRKQVATRLGLVGHPQLALRIGVSEDSGAPGTWTPPATPLPV
jgi:nitroreductase